MLVLRQVRDDDISGSTYDVWIQQCGQTRRRRQVLLAGGQDMQENVISYGSWACGDKSHMAVSRRRERLAYGTGGGGVEKCVCLWIFEPRWMFETRRTNISSGNGESKCWASRSHFDLSATLWLGIWLHDGFLTSSPIRTKKLGG